MADASNDDSPVGQVPTLPDAHGEAALLLVESLIHGLIANASLSLGEAVDVVQTATDVQIDIRGEQAADRRTMPSALTLLDAIGASLRTDRTEDVTDSGSGDHVSGATS